MTPKLTNKIIQDAFAKNKLSGILLRKTLLLMHLIQDYKEKQS